MLPEGKTLNFAYTSGVLSARSQQEISVWINGLSIPSQNLHDNNLAPAVGGRTFRGSGRWSPTHTGVGLACFCLAWMA